MGARSAFGYLLEHLGRRATSERFARYSRVSSRSKSGCANISAHHTLEPFTITLRSSDASVFATRQFDVAVRDAGASSGSVAPLGPGLVWLVWEAPGYAADSLLFEFTP